MVPRPRALFRRPELALAILAFGAYAYFFQGGGWNQNSRFALTRALVERRSVVIDEFVFNTGDFSVRDHHIYSDKAPGVSAAAAPVWAAVHAFTDGRPRGRHVNLGAYLATVAVVALPAALAVGAVFRAAVALGAGPPAAAALAAAYAFGTHAFPYSTLFYGHQTAAAALVIPFAILVEARARGGDPGRARASLAGALLAFAVACEYPVALIAAVIGAYALAVVRPRERLVWALLGALVPAAALAVYHTAAFGGPFTTGYSTTILPGRKGGLFLGITLPDLALMDDILFSLERGLLRQAPWLALAAPGALRMIRSRPLRAEGLACAAIIVVFLLLNCSLTRTPDDWRGGAGLGPRYLVPSLAFYALAVAGLLTPPPARPRSPVLRRLAVAAFAVAAAMSAGRMVVATAVHPEVDKVDDPYADWLLPHWRAGRLSINTVPFHGGASLGRRHAWNLGERMGLEGRLTLLPLALFAAASAGGVVHALRRRAPERPPADPDGCRLPTSPLQH